MADSDTKKSKSKAGRKKSAAVGHGVSAASKSDKQGAATPYVVLARKYRPQSFADLIGQDALVATVQNAFAAGRIAQAYMLTGVRGVGKTTTARILARALNFARDGSPEAPTTDLPRDPAEFGLHCADIMESRHPDVIEMDAASNTGIDNIREIIESARYKPLVARYKVFIIDEVHMLSKGAFNALLKTLEEPPEHVKFIFATTEIRKVPVTVLSRCQRFDLRRVDVEELSELLTKITDAEGATAESDALRLIARAAEGSVRDGLSILDQGIAFQQSAVTEAGVRAMLGLADRGRIFDLLEHLLAGRTKQTLEGLNALHKDGAEPARVLSDLAEAVHLSTRIRAVGAQDKSEGLSEEEQRRASAIAEQLSVPLLSRAWQMLLKGIEETARSPAPLSAAEMVLIRISYTSDLPSPDVLIRTLGGASAPARNGASPPRPEPSGSKSPQSAASSVPDQRDPPWVAGNGEPGTTTAGIAAGRDDDLDLQTSRDPATDDSLFPSEGHFAPNPKTFDDVLSLVGTKRDAKLKVHLEEHVSVVKFDLQTNSVDLHLLPGAPQTIANELREKLNAWTGSHWIIMLSKTPGQIPVAQARREALEAEIEKLRTDPAVKAALEAFPDAKIVSVAPLDTLEGEDDTEAETG